MSRLQDFFAMCNSEVIIYYNGHRGNSETVEDYIDGWGSGDERLRIDRFVLGEMIKRDTVIAIQFYPVNNIGFGLVFHYDLNKAVELAFDAI